MQVVCVLNHHQNQVQTQGVEPDRFGETDSGRWGKNQRHAEQAGRASHGDGGPGEQGLVSPGRETHEAQVEDRVERGEEEEQASRNLLSRGGGRSSIGTVVDRAA